MTSEKQIRLATEMDVAQLLTIYAPFVSNTVITFEYEVPTALAFSSRVTNTLRRYPWLVCEIDGRIVGYAYAHQHQERAAYDWSVDVSIYIHPDYHRRNVASALYQCLLQILRLQGFYNAFAGITASNTPSIAFHESMGFKQIGCFHHVGYKLGQWHDVLWFEYMLAEPIHRPEQPRGIHDIEEMGAVVEALSRAAGLIKD
jgi:L-amino acid N-acyltransferase YncA